MFQEDTLFPWLTVYQNAILGLKITKSLNKDNIIQRVVRGGSANLKRTPISHNPYPENISDNYWGFRLIVYK